MHSVEGAVAKVLVEREGECQPPLPTAQPHVPAEVRVRVIVLDKGVGLELGFWLWPGLELVFGLGLVRVAARTCAARWASRRAAAAERGSAARTLAPGVNIRMGSG